MNIETLNQLGYSSEEEFKKSINDRLQSIDNTIKYSYKSYDEYMYFNHPDVLLGKSSTNFDDLNEDQEQKLLDEVHNEIYGHDFESAFNPQATLIPEELGREGMSPLQDYMMTREDKQ